ncbi:hypothetical protein ACIBJF_25785 [Streptomyces sp. NPDC050743]|uniref:MmyB family transcriptional regulator n=1 Tax=Streptomyces sp. NPDC050743 TaxID=3365634 RepID=UPI0037974AF0
MRILLDGMAHSPAFVPDTRMNLLAWNALGDAVNGFGRLAPAERNVPRLVFLDPAGRELYPEWHAVAAQIPAAPEHRIVVYTPEPGSETAERLAPPGSRAPGAAR